MIKRLTSVALVCTLLSAFLMIPAKAAPLTGSCDVFYAYNKKSSALDTFYNYSSEAGTISYSQANFEGATYSNNVTFPVNVGLNGLQGFANIDKITSNVVVTFSYFVYGSGTFHSEGDYTPVLTFNSLDGNNQTSSGSYTTFTPTTSWSNYSPVGVSVVGTFEGSEDNPLSNPRIEWDARTLYCTVPRDKSCVFQVTSFKVIASSAPSADLVELQNIAKGIAESNQILSAMYGDILAVCNSIYERTGSILEAQNLTNQYFASIIPLLESIKSTTNNIYTLLSQQFSLLISTIQSESDDIQAAINAAVDRMIAYLDGAFSSSINPALPGTSEDINTGVDSWNQAENGYQSDASERFQSITADFSGFSGDVLSGIGLASTLFQRVWNALGSYVLVYTVPLTLSLCLLVVGRVSRSHSRGGGSSKSKDDGGET